VPSALVVTDLLTTYDFEDADRLAESVEETVPAVRTLLHRAEEVQAPIIDPDLARAALEMMRRNMDADLSPAAGCAL
jgi:hypothetical protein